MIKVVYNTCFGGFSLSKTAVEFIAKRKGIEPNELDIYSLPRHDPDLVKSVENFSNDIDDNFGTVLEIKEIDSDRYFIHEYDGSETVVTPELLEEKWVKVMDKEKPPLQISEITKEVINLLKKADDSYRQFRAKLIQISNEAERLSCLLNKEN